ncbi:MAG: hypothetical protein GXP58_12195 [Deltaproteobacteria bacterium]|nr:hypothetical protein [Deltaproteobacteria bacterium]
MTATYYLRMEGVNLLNFVFDTQDLSTARGGSLLMLDAVGHVQKRVPRLEPVTTGASSGLFRFEMDDGDADDSKARQICNSVMDCLKKDPRFKHATFVVDFLRAEDDFITVRETLLAKNRFQQMRSPTVAVPKTSRVKNVVPCELDGVRPAVKAGPKGKKISESVWQRWKYGREEKQEFYRKELVKLKKVDQKKASELVPLNFANDFDELTSDRSRGNLHHKMAVIYLDGNGFGGLQSDVCNTRKLQEDFDTTIKNYRRGFLKTLLSEMKDRKEWISAKDNYRLETLLWGGDEIIWIVPAWLGWRVLKRFYEESESWEFHGNRLTHGGGIVFCHHNAPIHRITKLAKDLAELAKEKSREENLFAYEVLESFDHIGRDLMGYRREICPNGCSPDDMILEGGKMGSALDKVAVLRENFPRRKLYAIVKGLTRGDPGTIKVIEKTIKSLDLETKKALEDLKDPFGGEVLRWLHLALLWDYLVE